MDAVTGDPLPGVLVVDEVTSRYVVTNQEGHFELALPAGSRRLTVSIVGYGLVRREVAVPGGGVVDLLFPLAGGTGTYSETVTVAPERFRRMEPVVAAQQVLDSADLQNLRGVLADDPMRAIQALPGVATGDDLRSEFSVRGSDFAHMNYRRRLLLTSCTPSARSRIVELRSVAMINSDVLESVTLSTAATRSASATGPDRRWISGCADGSRDRNHRHHRGQRHQRIVRSQKVRSGRRGVGSWLVSARQSYLDLVLDRLVDDQVSFGFTDAQGRLRLRPDIASKRRSHRHRRTIRLEEPEEEIDSDNLYLGDNASALAIGGWRLTLPRGWLSARVFSAANEFRNETRDRTPLDKGHDTEIAGRVDVAWQAPGRTQVEGGALVEHTWESRQRQRPIAGAAYAIVNDYAGEATRSGVYFLSSGR